MRLTLFMVLASGALLAPACSTGAEDDAATDVTVDAGSEARDDAGSGAADDAAADAADADASGPPCVVADDCASRVCAGGVCQPASPSDGVKNGDETDVDCGGSSTANRCGEGKACGADTDCDRLRCNTETKVCNPPSNADGLMNGTETDVDCGGSAPTNAPRCAEGKTCGADDDCVDPYCSFDKKCVTGRSCKGVVGNATAGLVTCGRYEATNPAKQHESCCRSLPLPTTNTVRLDKYEITAGRVRQFLESIPGGNVRQWVANEIATNTDTGKRLANDLPVNVRDLLPASDAPGEPLNLVAQTGAYAMDTRLPSDLQGCFTDWKDEATGAWGHPTYWWPQALLQSHLGDSEYGGPNKGRLFSQADYDQKSMNCAPYWIFAAFCAWDGGRLPTYQEVSEAWGPSTYPWGTNTYTLPRPPTGNQTYEDTANYLDNKFGFYGYPDFADARDSTGRIAAPGRFISDKTAVTTASGESWFDLGANLMEMTHAISGGVPGFPAYSPGIAQGDPNFCDFSLGGPGGGGCPAGSTLRATGLIYSPWVGGSFEGHYGFNSTVEPFFERVSYNLSLQTQYGKTGARCAR